VYSTRHGKTLAGSIRQTSMPSLFSGSVGGSSVIVTTLPAATFPDNWNSFPARSTSLQPPKSPTRSVSLRMLTCSLPLSLPSGFDSSAAIETPLGTAGATGSGTLAGVRC